MTETYMKIPGPDGHAIYGTLRTDEKPRDRLVVHLHGMTHTMNQLLEATSRDFLRPTASIIIGWVFTIFPRIHVVCPNPRFRPMRGIFKPF